MGQFPNINDLDMTQAIGSQGDSFQNCGDAVALAINSSHGSNILPRGGLDSDSIIQAANSLGTPVYRGGEVSTQNLHSLGPGTVIRYDRTPGSADYKYGKDHAEITAVNPNTGQLSIASYSSPDKPMIWKPIDENYIAKLPKNAVITNLLPKQQQAMNVMGQRLQELQSQKQPQQIAQAQPGQDFYSQSMNFFTSKGYSPAQAAGIVGNLMHESGGNPDISHDKGAGYGLAGWNGDRRQALYQFSGNDRPDINQQLAFVDYELKNSEPQAYQALQQAKSPEQAAQIFSNLYERPGKPMMNERIKHSRNAMNAYSMGQAGSMAAGPATPSGMPDISQLDMGQAIKSPDVSQLDMGQAVQGPEEKSLGQQIVDKALSYVPSLPSPDTWNWKPAAQYGGMALGGLAGSALGPVGSVAGGTLGYGMGNELYNLLTGNQPSLNSLREVAQHTGSVLKEGAENALMAESAVPAISKVAQIAGKVIKPTLGRLSGTGTKAIEKSLEGSPDFVKGLKGELSGEDIVQNARDAIGVVRDSRSLDYLDKFKQIANMPNEIDITPVKTKIAELMKSFRVKVMPDGELNFGTMAVNDTGRKDIKKMIDTIDNWDDFTPAGVDAMKRYIGDFYSDSSQARAFVTPLRQSINNLLAKEIPGYHEMTKNYAQQTQLINEIEKGLSLKKAELGGKATADQTLRRLMSAMRDNFKLRGDLLESLSSESGMDISAQVAGHAMSSIMPYGLGGSAPAIGLEIASTIWHPKLAALFISSSPKVQGEFLRYWGKSLAELESLSPLAKKGLGYGSTSYAESLLRKKGETPSLQPAFQY